MFTEGPSGSSPDPTYNYSTDVDRNETPRLGLTMLRTQSVAGCALQVAAGTGLSQTLDLPLTETTPQVKTHTWLSPPLEAPFAPLTSADATLELWTKSVAGAAYQGDLCVYVFKRITVQQQLPGNITNTFVFDSPATLANAHPYLEIQKATWPQDWTKLSTGSFGVTMLSVDSVLTYLSSHGIPGTLTSPSQRLGLALTVNGSGTSGDALDVMYDHPTFDSRFEFDTTQGTCIIPCS